MHDYRKETQKGHKLPAKVLHYTIYLLTKKSQKYSELFSFDIECNALDELNLDTGARK